MATYTETKSILDEIANRTRKNGQRLQQARDLLQLSLDDLNNMASGYAGFSTQLNTDAAANPGDAAWQTALAEKDEMVSDFQEIRTRAIALLAAIDGV